MVMIITIGEMNIS